jgi:outer membrane lipoprotein-sorting protein
MTARALVAGRRFSIPWRLLALVVCAAAVGLVVGLQVRQRTSANRPTPTVVGALKEALRAPGSLSYRALETLTVTDQHGVHRQQIRLTHRAPDATRREYLSDRGDIERVVVDDGRSHWQYLPQRREVVFSPSLRVDEMLWEGRHLDDLLDSYVVTQVGRETVGGRSARVLLVAPRRGHPGPSKELWVDDRTGLILRSLLTSADGTTKLAASLSQVRFDGRTWDDDFTPPRNATKQTVTYEQVAALPVEALARHWKHRLMVPGGVPRGYLLDSARLLGKGPSSIVQLRYFDGLNTISLFEAPPGAPGGTGDGSAGRAAPGWGSEPPFSSLTWRQRGLTLTLVSDLPRDRLLGIARSITPFSD